MTGMTRDFAEDLTRSPLEFVHEDDCERIMGLWTACLEDRQSFTAEYRLKKSWQGVNHFTQDEITGETW